jgi:hypothetical protein
MHLHTRCFLVVGIAIVTLVATSAMADPLVDLTLLGRITGSGADYKNQVTAHPGDSIDVQIMVGMATIGTSNTQGTTTRTITSLTWASIQGDGVNSLKFNVAKLLGKPETTLAGAFAGGFLFNPDPSPMILNDSWGAGIGANGGTISGTDLTGVRPIHSPGVFTGITPEDLGDSVFSFAGGSGWLSVQPYASSVGAAKANSPAGGGSGTVFAITWTTESGPDPVCRYTPLGINIPSNFPGDANGDRVVDITDLSRVLTNYDKSGMAWADGDFDGNGTVDISDLSKLLANYDKTATAALHAVPEPATPGLLATGMLAFAACAWRKSK